MIGSFLTALKAAAWWFIEQIYVIGNNILESVSAIFAFVAGYAVDLVSPLVGLDSETVMPFVNLANYWVPLDLAFWIISVNIFVDTFILMIRTVIKFVPKIGG